MLKSIQKIIKKIVQSFGFDIYRLSPSSNSSLQMLKGLNHFEVDVVFDIGANIGQFASELRSMGYKGKIVSFEPLPDAHKKLIEKASGDKSWDIHTQCAIGDFDGEIEINVAGNSVSSSILPMLEKHSDSAKNSAYIGKIKSPISCLDSVVGQYLSDSEKFFIKIDTQGFEWQVLDGATESLAQAQGVLCELSLVPLYQGQRLWKEMIERLQAEGFVLWAVQKGFTEPLTGQTLQIDAIFYRKVI